MSQALVEGKVVQSPSMAQPIACASMARPIDTSQYARSLIEASLDPLVAISPNGEINDVNEATIKVTGVPREKLVGSDFTDYFTEPAKARAGYEQVFADGCVTDYPLTIRHKNGHLTEVLCNASLYKDAGGNVLGVVAAARDVTAQKMAEEKLHELHVAIEQRANLETAKTLDYERNLLRQLMSNIPDAVFFKDREHRFTRLNEPKRVILGLTKEQPALGLTLGEINSSAHAQMQQEEEDEIFATGDTVVDRIDCSVQRDGSERWYSVSKAPIFDEDGAIDGLVGITRDITDRHMAERLKDEFVSTVNHELRTPLTSIVGAIRLLADERTGELPARAKGLIKIANENCARLTKLVNDILEIDSVETGGLAFDIHPLALRALVARAVDAHQPYAGAYGVKVRLDNTADDAVVLADTGRLTQVIENFLSNASKFSPSGTEVLVTIKKCGESVRIAIRDHGPGIPDNYKQRIFEKFVQVQASDARSRGGSGLGLSIAKQVVDRLGGQIGLEDAAGGGSIFTIVLPTSAQTIPAEVDRFAGAGSVCVAPRHSESDFG